MPTVYRFDFCRIEIRYRDHQPPHVHVIMADRREALVEIETLKVVGNIPLHELKEPLAWIAANANILLETWNRCHI